MTNMDTQGLASQWFSEHSQTCPLCGHGVLFQPGALAEHIAQHGGGIATPSEWRHGDRPLRGVWACPCGAVMVTALAKEHMLSHGCKAEFKVADTPLQAEEVQVVKSKRKPGRPRKGRSDPVRVTIDA